MVGSKILSQVNSRLKAILDISLDLVVSQLFVLATSISYDRLKKAMFLNTE